MSEMMQQIDVVIAWVDGNDPKLRHKRMQFQGKTEASEAVSDTRFASNHEIYYNVASILKYVPFCRHIYIVTDNQQPKWINEFVQDGICETDKIRIIDHREIFAGYEQFLPTFNTRSIETMLWNIKGLSDYFFYLNDDFFFNGPSKIEDILSEQKMVIYGHWQSSFMLKIKLWYRKLLNKYFAKSIEPKHMIAQMLGANMLGFKNYFEIHHYPHAVDRKILRDYLLVHPKFLEKQIKYRFRSIEQFNPISLMNHLKIQKNEALLKPDLEIAYLKNESSLNGFLQSLANEQIKYGCMQSLDQLDTAATAKIYAALNKKLIGYIPKVLLAETA